MSALPAAPAANAQNTVNLLLAGLMQYRHEVTPQQSEVGVALLAGGTRRHFLGSDKLSPRMRPSAKLCNAWAFTGSVVTRVVIALYIAFVALQQMAGNLAATIVGVVKQSNELRRRSADPRPHIGFALGVIALLIEYLDRLFVVVHDRIGQHFLLQQIHQRLDQLAGFDHPAGQGIAVNIDAVTTEYFSQFRYGRTHCDVFYTPDIRRYIRDERAR